VIQESKSNLQIFTALACQKDEYISVSVFHDLTDKNEIIQTYAKNILAEFSNLNKEEVKGLRSTFDKLADDQETQVKAADILERFKSFDAIAQEQGQKAGLVL